MSETIQVLGRLWPKKNIPKYIDRDALLSRIKKMCSMGMLRRFVYTREGNNIVLYSTTPEFCKVIYQALKLNTDARHEKDILPPLEMQIVYISGTSSYAQKLFKTQPLDFLVKPIAHEEYIGSMEEFITNPNEVASSRNFEVDSVKNYMLHRAKQELLTVDVNARLP